MNTITVSTIIDKQVDQVWESWINPEYIKQWAFASDDWTVGEVENEVREGGRFKTNMHAKDNSAGFDFTGKYTVVNKNKELSYIMDDGRTVQVLFEDRGDKTKVIETFEMENENSEELQRHGWQAILNNFKKFVEMN
jgi:uncharacterized protein YndB with AHSA1/START domain